MQERLKWKLFKDKSCELVRNPKRKAGQRGGQVGGRAECELDGSEEEVEVLARPGRSSGWVHGPSQRKGCVGVSGP